MKGHGCPLQYCSNPRLTLPPRILTKDLLDHGLAGQDARLQVRQPITSAELAILQGFLSLKLPATNSTVQQLWPEGFRRWLQSHLVCHLTNTT